MLKSKHFSTEQQLLDCVNEEVNGQPNIRCGDIISIIKSETLTVVDEPNQWGSFAKTEENWILFYCD